MGVDSNLPHLHAISRIPEKGNGKHDLVVGVGVADDVGARGARQDTCHCVHVHWHVGQALQMDLSNLYKMEKSVSRFGSVQK